MPTSKKADNLDTIITRLRGIKPGLQGKYFVARLAVFGSFARGDFGDESDVDLLIEFSKTPGIEFVDIASEIENVLGRSVDLVSKNAIQSHYLRVIEPELVDV